MNYEAITTQLYTKRRLLYSGFIHCVGYARAVKKFIINSDYLKPSMRILDAGCGFGLLTKIFYRIQQEKKVENIQFYGFDLTPAMLDQFLRWITKKQMKNITLAQADVLKPEQLPQNWNNFDLVTVSGMLEHLPRECITEGISNLKNKVKKGGTLLIFICRKNWLAYWLIKKFWRAEIYTKEEMETILNNAGIKNYTFKKFPVPFGYLNSWVHSIEANI